MRLKAVPAEAIGFVENHALAFAVGGAILVGGYFYIVNHQSAAANMNADPFASTQAAYTYGMPMVNSGSGGIVDAISNPNATVPNATDSGTTGGVSNLDLFNFEQLKESH